MQLTCETCKICVHICTSVDYFFPCVACKHSHASHQSRVLSMVTKPDISANLTNFNVRKYLE